jgi:hypothetical protein
MRSKRLGTAVDLCTEAIDRATSVLGVCLAANLEELARMPLIAVRNSTLRDFSLLPCRANGAEETRESRRRGHGEDASSE